jgi:hypothetical protein
MIGFHCFELIDRKQERHFKAVVQQLLFLTHSANLEIKSLMAHFHDTLSKWMNVLLGIESYTYETGLCLLPRPTNTSLGAPPNRLTWWTRSIEVFLLFSGSCWGIWYPTAVYKTALALTFVSAAATFLWNTFLSPPSWESKCTHVMFMLRACTRQKHG